IFGKNVTKIMVISSDINVNSTESGELVKNRQDLDQLRTKNNKKRLKTEDNDKERLKTKNNKKKIKTKR
ncbi:18398_t:CDS:1, partial [Gigaspora rosea]